MTGKAILNLRNLKFISHFAGQIKKPFNLKTLKGLVLLVGPPGLEPGTN